MPGPMEGVRVVELGVWIAGPAIGGLLADWGADVIKIEPIEGDPARTFREMLGGDLPTNPPFELDNRSKRSIALDLSDEAGRRVAEELIDGADVFVTNVRAAALERLGLDDASVRGRNPRLVYCAMTGYGLDGPDADRAAYDIAAFWSRSGIANQLTFPGADPPFQRGGMGDHTAGVAGAAAISAALYHRERTGEGQLVSSSLFRTGMYVLSFDINVKLLWGLSLGAGDRNQIANPAINNYKAGDGRRFWIVGLEGDRHWPPLARAVGHPEWLTDPRFETARSRAQHAAELIALLDDEFAKLPLDEWAEVFAAEPDLFWAPINTLDELLADPQLGPAGGLVDVPDGATGTTMVASPVDFHGTPAAPRSTAPELGQHTDELLVELGRSPEQIAQLRSTRICR